MYINRHFSYKLRMSNFKSNYPSYFSDYHNSHKSNDDFNISEKDFLSAIRANKLDPNSLNSKGETLFQYIVSKNYYNAVSYLTMKKDKVKDFINYASNNKTPLDFAVSDEMRDLLIARGALSYKELSPDAKESAARVFMSNPIAANSVTVQTEEKVPDLQKELSKGVGSGTIVETSGSSKMGNVENIIDYFYSFEEVEEGDLDKEGEEKLKDKGEKNHKSSLGSGVKETFESNVSEDKIVDEVKEYNKEVELPNSYKNYNPLIIKPDDPQSLDSIIGLDDIKQELRENVIIPLIDKRTNVVLKANNIDIPNGILFNSLANSLDIVKALSQETGMPVLQLLDPNGLGPMLKDVEKNYQKTGNKTIILAQGFDKFFKGASCNPLEEYNFKLALENCGEKGVIFIATTSDKENICDDFIDSGILDKVLEIKNPDLDDRIEFLEKNFKAKHIFSELNTDENIKLIAELSEGFSFANIKQILDESARTALADKKDVVSIEVIKNELEEFSKDAGIVPINEFNKTAMYDTPEFSRVPVMENEPMKLDELGGMPEVKERLKNLYIKPMRNLDLLMEELGYSAIPDGAIFYGPAGNGKTLTAKTLARELKLPFYETKLSDIGTSLVHEEGKALKKLAKQLDDKFKATGERSVWFLDEFDSMGAERGGASQHNKELTDALLQEFNNPQERGFILIVAANDINSIDSALKRRGRLGNWIPFSNPDFSERVDLLTKELKKSKYTSKIADRSDTINYLAKEFDGSSNSSIVSVLTDAKRMSILDNKDFIASIKACLDIHAKREIAEFCNKAGLKPHEYKDWDFKSLDELGGMSDVKQQLIENVVDIWDPEIRAALLANKRRLPGGVMLEGSSGTGKTTIVETLARHMGVPLYKMNYAQADNEYIHVLARNVTDIFNRLALESKIIKKPVMLFFDEAEKFFPRYAERHQIEEVNTYKELMNTASQNNIILVGATNHIDLVNQEIVGNPRRMGTIIHCGNPNEEDRMNLFTTLLVGLPILSAPLTREMVQELALISEGLSIGEISDFVDKTITQAVKKKQNITFDKLISVFKSKAKCL